MKNLYLITDNFPYGQSEKSFIIPELRFLVTQFNITIISSSETNTQITKLNNSIKVLHYKKHFTVPKILKYIIKMLFNKSFLIEMFEIIKAKEKMVYQLFDSIKFFINSENFYEYLINKKVLTTSTDCLVYSYWSNYKLYAICNNRNKHPKITIITRVHGYDLYNERNKNGRLPFRSCIDRNVDRIIFASKYAREYYLKSYKKKLLEKYPLFKLGVINTYGIANYHKQHYMTIVSCSNIISLKRIDLIIKSLALIKDIKVKWVHFGDGVSFNEIENLAYNCLSGKENVKYELRGYVDYLEIHKFYQKNVVDCFITTSSTEGGCPVSIQEALSYGIPIIGTNVGGISEMINGNGFLLGEIPALNEILESIRKINKMDAKSYISFRKKSREIWRNNYDANSNYKLFVEYIKEL